jgi:hypothetical protein
MSADEPILSAEYLKRQRLIDELESSVNERIIAAISEDDEGSDEEPYVAGGELPHGDKMATESDLRTAEIAAAEARTDTKIVRLEGKLDLVLETVKVSREEARDNRRAVIANGWVIFGALVIIIGVLYTTAPILLDLGFKWRETIAKEIQERLPPAPAPPSIPR